LYQNNNRRRRRMATKNQIWQFYRCEQYGDWGMMTMMRSVKKVKKPLQNGIDGT
jgi:hypothetical protein